MSKHYTAFQYDAAYKPVALRNWEIPKYGCHRPRQRTGRTRIIANAMGNLLPGVHRSEDSPWGNFVGTWSMPRRIDRKTAAILNDSVNHKMKAQKCYHHYTGKPIKPPEFIEDSEEAYADETKPEANAKKVISEEIQEQGSKKDEESTVEDQQEASPTEGVAEKETVDKPFCPIHDVIPS